MELRLRKYGNYESAASFLERPPLHPNIMITQLDRVVLTTDLPKYHYKTGRSWHRRFSPQEGLGYEVEFMTLAGKTIAIVS